MLLRRAGPPAALLAAAWAAMVGLLVLTGQGVTHSVAVESLDRQITSWIVAHRTPALDRWMAVLTFTGSWLAALGVAAVVAVLAMRRRVPPRDLVAVLAGWAGVALAVPVTKSLVQRPRPPESVRLLGTHGWSFPSGHTATAVVVFGTVTTLTVLLVHRRAVRAVALTACPLLVGVIAFSRVELGVHWTTDVAASVVWTAGVAARLHRRPVPRVPARGRRHVAQIPEVTTRGLPGRPGRRGLAGLCARESWSFR
jgi:undecaprenyl-diphosphatase